MLYKTIILELLQQRPDLHDRLRATATIYPDADERRRLYRSGLPPRLGDQLARLYPQIKQYLLDGYDYATRDPDGRFAFMEGLVGLLATHPRFVLAPKTPRNVPWERILRWWLDPSGPVATPGATKVSDWYDYVATNFSYRFAWGIGCTLALAANEAHQGKLQPTTLERWRDLDLPWIALWLKELTVWGTLDPVAAYLLGRGRTGTRSEASALAVQYYEVHQTLDPDSQLDPRTIRAWAETLPKASPAGTRPSPKPPFTARLERTFPKNAARRWRVLPSQHGDRIQWIDPAGYLLASGERPQNWMPRFLDDGDFFLDVDSGNVEYEPYL